MPVWLQILYTTLAVLVVPFAAYILVRVQKNEVEIEKIKSHELTHSAALVDTLAAIHKRCEMEQLGRREVRFTLSRMDRNITRIGAKMDIALEETKE